MKNGIYEQLINRKVKEEISEENIKNEYHIETENIDKAEASKILTDYLKEIVENGLKNIAENGKGFNIEKQVNITNKIVDLIKNEMEDEAYENLVVEEAADPKQLLAFYEKKNSKFALDDKQKMNRPETSIAQSSLFTGASHEPQMFSELKNEIVSSDRIDILVSFIKWSGLRLIINELKEFTDKGGILRIITTSYMGATDVKAVEELNKLKNTEVKISYDTKRTRLHAKSYIFYRDSGYTTAYIGSSNISNAALSSGLEWNVKITKKDLPETVAKIDATFENYWNSDEFVSYSEEEKDRLISAIKLERNKDFNKNKAIYTMDVKPYGYQREILDKLSAERIIRGHYKNLIVAATGTGKTVIAAFDYKRFCMENPKKHHRLLFVAHREEILLQSLSTFRAVLKDANFGELFVGRNVPENIDNLFISIQTFNSRDFTSKTSEDFYNYIVVDEFHHAAAKSYSKLLDYYKPDILLGLTATPERMDGKDVTEYFDNRIAAEIRLPEAIDRKLLCPFQYFGITDEVDLNNIKWSAGGYDRRELENIYAMSGIVAEKRANLVAGSIEKYVTDIDDVKGLGFCVSIKHARFMSDYFNSCNIPSIALCGESSDEERKNAKNRLVSGEIKFIFVVDIYNEGVDIPEVNTVLFLRPTESLTVFLQQLGRGLRLSKDKECLTVLDFIGQQNNKYNFEDKFASLLSNTSKSVKYEIEKGFIGLPKGCYIQLEKMATEYILKNIKDAYGSEKALVNRIRSFKTDSGLEPTLSNFIEYYHINPGLIYKFSSFSRLSVKAEVKKEFTEPGEEVITKALKKLTYIDSCKWIKFLINYLENINSIEINDLSENEKRMLNMFYVTIWNKYVNNWQDKEVIENIKILKESPVMIKEVISLMNYRFDKIDVIEEEVNLGYECPAEVHCNYSLYQILTAFDYSKIDSMRQGVLWVEEKNTDLFFITLNKSDKDYSPTTMYEDYSISETLFHWQSQSTTSETSPTGMRYINHEKMKSKVLLFVREFKKDEYGNAMPYTFLGPAKYVKHSGSNPMNIVWKLYSEIPAKYLKKTSKMVV